MVRLGIRRLLGDGFEVEEAASLEEALDLVRDIGGFDVAIVDLQGRLNGDQRALGGRDALRELRKVDSGLPIVAHGSQAERHAATAMLKAGATAYVSRGASAEDFRRAVEAALERREFVDPALPPKGSRGRLTRRQCQILQLVADGGSIPAAARALDVTEETVKTHMKHVLARLEARNRAHAVAIALRESLIE